MYQEKNKYRLMALQAVWLFLVVIAGIIYVCYTWIRIENHHSEDALQIARSIEVTLPKDDLKQLEAKAGDIDKPQYRIVKNTLKEIIRVNPKARFAYIYIEQNDKLYFIADSEPENSTDYSPPGQEYTEADIAYKRSFKEGKEFIAGHITDRWGRWVSILVPITDPASGKTIAVFGLDFNAKSWGYLLLFEVIESGVLVVFLLFALFMLVRIRAKNKLLKNDITERKQAEEALRTSEARYRLLVENANEVIVVAQDGMLKFVNRMTVELFGYSEQELTSRPFPEFVHPDDRGMVVERHLKRLKGDVFQPRYAFRLVGRDGSIKWVEIGAVLIDWEGKPATLNFINDITERKQAEDAARKAQAELLEQRQHEKEHAEAELAQMRDRLVRATRLAAIGQVSASIAHDLRNPLGTVRNAAYYLERRLPKDQPEVTEYLGIINQEVAAADRIITNLLAVAGAKEPVKQHVDVGQAIREALARTGQAKAVRLRMSLAPEPFMVRADPDHLRQVFRNLVTNAAEAMGDGGEIIVEAARDADGDSIVLRDTGPGVAQEIRESVFEPLVTTKAKGIGLGLTICREIIEHHGGGIELIDEGKPGAAFRIRLPRQ